MCLLDLSRAKASFVSTSQFKENRGCKHKATWYFKQPFHLLMEVGTSVCLDNGC